MFKNKAAEGKNNICGEKIRELRLNDKRKMSQRMLADALQLCGLDIDKNAVQHIEAGKRFVTDIELKSLSDIFGVSCDELLGNDK